jgi:hypothetical protein
LFSPISTTEILLDPSGSFQILSNPFKSFKILPDPSKAAAADAFWFQVSLLLFSLLSLLSLNRDAEEAADAQTGRGRQRGH